jgi:hypothetical protein
MRVLTNDYRDFELLNLGNQTDGRGDFMVRQEGIPPHRATIEQDRFYLRGDGVWVINLAVFALPEEEQARFLFPEIADVYATVEKLVGVPVVLDQLPEGKTHDELLAAMRASQDQLWRRVRSARRACLTSRTTDSRQ